MTAEKHYGDNTSKGEDPRGVDGPDLTITGGPRDTVFVLGAHTESGLGWIEEYVSEDGYQPWWPDVIVEHSYLKDLVEAVLAAGLTVSWDQRAMHKYEP